MGFAKNVPDMIPIKLIKIRQTFDRDSIVSLGRVGLTSCNASNPLTQGSHLIGPDDFIQWERFQADK